MESQQRKVEFRNCQFSETVVVGELIFEATKTDGLVLFRSCGFSSEVELRGHFADGAAVQFIDCEFNRSQGAALTTTQLTLSGAVVLVHGCMFASERAEVFNLTGINATANSRVAVQHCSMQSLADSGTGEGYTKFRLGGSNFTDSVVSITHSHVVCVGNHDAVDFGKEEDKHNRFTRSTLLIAHNTNLTANIKDAVEIYGVFTDSTVKIYNNTISDPDEVRVASETLVTLEDALGSLRQHGSSGGLRSGLDVTSVAVALSRLRGLEAVVLRQKLLSLANVDAGAGGVADVKNASRSAREAELDAMLDDLEAEDEAWVE